MSSAVKEVVEGKKDTTNMLSMAILGKRGALSLGRNAVRGLGSPRFIKVLVSENYDKLVFAPCKEKEPLSFKVPELKTGVHYGMRIHSKSFVQEVMSRNKLDKNRTYLFGGSYLRNQAAIVFSLLSEDGSGKEK